MSELPRWVAEPALLPIWARIRSRFEAAGLEASGRVVLRFSDRDERHAVSALLGRAVTRDSVQIDLAELDARLRERSGVGGLGAVLTELFGSPPTNRVAARESRSEARERPLALARELSDQAAWTDEWVAGMRRTGLLTGRPDAERTVTDAARVLRVLTEPRVLPVARSRVELAAQLLGDAHALDRDRLLHQVVLRGLAAASGLAVPENVRDREELWHRFGIEPDLLSRTCLVWGLRLAGDDAVSRRLSCAADAGDPVHLTEWDLRRVGSFRLRATERVLVCENPRVLEALAESGADDTAAICTSGEPNLVVNRVLTGASQAGVDLRYHGDFDWAGIGIANRVVQRFGARPWRMAADDYVAAVRAEGPPLTGSPVAPSWDGDLGAAMRVHGRAVHEESALPELVEVWLAKE